MALEIFYSSPPSAIGSPEEQAMLEHLAGFPITIRTSEDDLDQVSGAIADVTTTTSERSARILYVARDLGKPTLLLAARHQAESLSQDLKGWSKIQPDGVLYSQPYIARSVASVFIMSQFKLSLPKSADVLEN